MAPFVVHQTFAQRPVSDVLIGRVDRGHHVQTARVGLFAILRVHHLPHHFRDVFRVHAEFLARALDDERLFARLVVLFLGDVVQLVHALQDVLLTHLRALRIDDRVIRGRRLRQTGQHGRFGQRQILQVLAEVHPRRARETIGALTEIDLIHVHLENLIFRQLRLDLVREQHFVDLARVGLLARKEEVARHLHRDRARALRGVAIGQRDKAGARDAGEVDAAVIVEARVFDGEDRLLQTDRARPEYGRCRAALRRIRRSAHGRPCRCAAAPSADSRSAHRARAGCGVATTSA